MSRRYARAFHGQTWITPVNRMDHLLQQGLDRLERAWASDKSNASAPHKRATTRRNGKQAAV